MSRHEWNLEKACANLAKHRVSFEEAETVPDTALAHFGYSIRGTGTRGIATW